MPEIAIEMTPPRTSNPASSLFNDDVLFKGTRSQWLPLYRRFLARMSTLSGMELQPKTREVSIVRTGGADKVGVIRITDDGLEIGLRLGKSKAKSASHLVVRSERLVPSRKAPLWVTHRVMISSVGQIDEEFMSWLKVARLQAGNARPQSISR